MPGVRRILVATDRSDAADRVVGWAADMADRYAAELVLLQVVAPENLVGQGAAEAADAVPALAVLAERLAGSRGKALVVFESDPSQAILRTANDEKVDVVVVGSVGMSARKEFLLGNIPNRVSHNAGCTVVIVNPDQSDGEAPRPSQKTPDQAEVAKSPAAGQLLRRAASISRVMAKHGVRQLFGSRDTKEQAKNFREALEELGPTFAKLGQILSTRPDLLPPDFVEELSHLQDRVPPLSEAKVVALMEAELRVPWEDVFQSIEPEPMAAGTIAQVHRAVLADGSRVVVKVQRPDAESVIKRDLGLLGMFAEQASMRPTLSQVTDLETMIDQLSASLERELDFRIEASNIERMRSVLNPYPRLAVPGLYRELSTKRLLVMEQVQGIPVLEAPQGPARNEAARQLLESYYHQVLSEGFFHADPHPGNLMWWNDTIYFLDLGMVGELDAGIRDQLLFTLLAFWQEDAAFLADVLLALSGDEVPPGLDQEALRSDLAALIAEYRHVTLERLRLGPLMQRLSQIAARHRLRLPASLALSGKAFGQMQLATAKLDPSLDPFSAAAVFFRHRLLAEARRAASPQQLFYQAQKLRVRLVRLVEGIERLTGARPGPPLRIEFGATDRLEASIRRAGRLVALGLAAGTVALAGVSIAISLGAAGAGAEIALGAIAGGLVLALLVTLLRT